ncbi:MAG TPA: hypothetical protein EYH42_07090 [Sulfurovum sp.]|nr:hypothetical protein [Sulfurovum sp.]
MSKIITAEIVKDKEIILSTFATFNKEKADVIIALANEIAEDLGAPSANNILIDIANKVKYGSYQANIWESHKEQFKTCNKCGVKKTLFSYKSNCHYLDYKNKTCKDCLALDVKDRGDFEHKKLSDEILTISEAIFEQTDIDEDIVDLAHSVLAVSRWSRHSPYKLRSGKNMLIEECQRIGFDYKKYLNSTGD